MAARSNSRRPFAWTEKELDEDVLPDRRKLAEALQAVCRYLVITTPEGQTPTHPTQAQAAKYLHVSETTLTRYLQGQRVPPEKVAAAIFDTACRDAGGSENVGVTKRRFLELRARAEQERCANCSRQRDAVRAAGQKLRALQDSNEQLERSAAEQARELGVLRQRAAALKQETQRVKATPPIPVGEAGPRKVRGAARPATLLPVPRLRGDRQQSKNGASTARSVGRRAEELLRGGRPDITLALLRHTAEAYTPLEVALLVALLRTQGQDELTDNLVHIYARDRNDQDVVRAALVLHEQRAIADAEALLRTAAAHPGPAVFRAAGAGPRR
jgi:transcriptional regulator with XRE-family HTH domain